MRQAKPADHVRETLHSTLLPVERMPAYVYDIPVTYREGDEKQVATLIARPPGPRIMTPFLLREGRLFCFNNLRNKSALFGRSFPIQQGPSCRVSDMVER